MQSSIEIEALVVDCVLGLEAVHKVHTLRAGPSAYVPVYVYILCVYMYTYVDVSEAFGSRLCVGAEGGALSSACIA